MDARGFLWCLHCKGPHPLDTIVCDKTGKPIAASLHAEKRHPLTGVILDGKYRIVRLLGSGGMADVFEAENVRLQRPVAIKVVKQKAPAEALYRLHREAQLLASLRHPNICDVYDFGTMGDATPYIVLELVVGETLANRLLKRGPMPANLVLDIFTQILSGLHSAHGARIVHRDLKPGNVLLAERLGCAPVPKVMDFGLAKDLSGGGVALTGHGLTVGTRAYMAPEQLAAKAVDARSDLFAVGLMLFETLTGVHPFNRSTTADLAAAILREPPPRIEDVKPELPRTIGLVIEKALEKSPDARFPNALAMQDALRDALGPISQRKPTPRR